MKINIARSAGFCFGVKRALDIAFQTARKNDKVCMLGDIVHNEEVVRQIKKAGIRKILTLGRGTGKILLLRAHGASQSIADAAGRSGYKIVDATCPMVKEIHKIARQMEQKGYKIIIIGDKKHEEVEGIVGQIKGGAIVIDDLKTIPFKTVKHIGKACIIVQSTQNLKKALKIAAVIKPYVEELKFFNTICHPTRMKQDEIRRMSKHNDSILVIGSKTSANTKRLYEIARSLNRRTFWCQSKGEIRAHWFKGARSVGITAGASTPDATISEAVAYIKKAAS